MQQTHTTTHNIFISSNHVEHRIVEFTHSLKNRKSLLDISEVKPRQGAPGFQSLYRFTQDIADYFEEKRSVSGYSGPVYSPFLVIDIDREDLKNAVDDMFTLRRYWSETYDFDCAEQAYIFFSGKKGFHLLIPGKIFGGFEPNTELPGQHKRVAQEICPIEIDEGMYQTLRLLRYPNTRHQKSGLFKIQLHWQELHDLEHILDMAKQPRDMWVIEDEDIEANEALTAVWKNIASSPGGKKPRKKQKKRGGNFCTDIAPGKRTQVSVELIGKLINARFTLDDITTIALTANEGFSEPQPPQEVIDRVKDMYARYGDINQKIDEMNRKHAIVSLGSSVAILHEHYDPRYKRINTEFLKKADFYLLYENQRVANPETDRDVSIAKLWLQSPNRREYDRLVFLPGINDLEQQYYNLWKGFGVESKQGDCSRFKEHIFEMICSGNDELFDYVFSWLADCVQRPMKKPGVSIVLRGKRGVGKGIFCNGVGRLFGQHFLYVNHATHITGRFNSHLKDTLLLYADEAFWAGDKQGEGVLKGLITEPFISIEQKYKDVVQMENHVHMLISSNADWVVPAGLEERRFCVIDVSDAKMQDHAYFKNIIEEMDNGGREALLHELMHHDLSGINLRDVPSTEALFEQKLSTMKPTEQWWFERLQDGFLFEEDFQYPGKWDRPLRVPRKALYDAYVKAIKDAGIPRPGVQRVFGKDLNRLCKSISKSTNREEHTYGRTREYCYRIPPLSVCRAEFEEIVRMKIPWEKGFDDSSFNDRKLKRGALSRKAKKGLKP